MSDSLGKQFRSARERAGMSVEDAARALKIKPARVEEMEQDVYKNFPSIAYARGFVVNYSKLLGINVRGKMEAFDCSGSFGLNDYQYLTTASPTKHMRPLTHEQKRGVPWGGLFATAAVLLLLGVGSVAAMYAMNLKRLGDIDTLGERLSNDGDSSETQTNPATATSDASPAPSKPVENPIENTPETLPSPQDLMRAAAFEGGIPPLLAAPPDPAAADDRALLREFSSAEGPSTMDSETVIVIRPIKRTWVKVMGGDDGSDPLFQSVLEPGEDPVRFSGHRFLIESTEDQALEISRNGQIIAQPTGRLVIE